MELTIEEINREIQGDISCSASNLWQLIKLLNSLPVTFMVEFNDNKAIPLSQRKRLEIWNNGCFHCTEIFSSDNIRLLCFISPIIMIKRYAEQVRLSFRSFSITSRRLPRWQQSKNHWYTIFTFHNRSIRKELS